MKNKILFSTLVILCIILIIYLIYNNIIKENFLSTKYILVSHLKGGLANRIFMIMAGLSFAEKWNMDYYFLDSEIKNDYHTDKETITNELKLLFPDIKFLDNSIDKSNWKKIKEKNEDVSNIKNIDTNVILYGYFQNDESNFYNYKLKFPEPNDNIFKIKDINNLFFIHFRFGDFVGTPREFNLVGYYKYCINHIKQKKKDPSFFLITNDIEVTKKYIKSNNLLNDNEYIIDQSKNRLDTLYYISECKGGICSNSTFSRIGAYFSKNRNKDLIYYPVKNNSNLSNQYLSWLINIVID